MRCDIARPTLHQCILGQVSTGSQVDITASGGQPSQACVSTCCDADVTALECNGLGACSHGDITVGAYRDIANRGSDFGILLNVATGTHNDAASIIGKDSRVLLDGAACRDGDVAILGTHLRVLIEVTTGTQTHGTTVVRDSLLVDDQVAGGADFDIALSGVQANLIIETQVRGDATDSQVTLQVIDLDATGFSVGHQLADLDVQRLVRAYAAVGFHRQIGGIDVAAAVGLGVGDLVARNQGHCVAGGASGQGAEVQRTAGRNGDIAVVGFQGANGQVVDFGQVDLAGGSDVDGVDFGVQGAVGITASGTNGTCCVDVQGVGNDTGAVVLIIVHRTVSLQIDLASAGVEAADEHRTTGFQVYVTARGLQHVCSHRIGFTQRDIARLSDLDVQGVDIGIQVDITRRFGYQSAALHVSLDGVAVDDRATGAGQAHGMGVRTVLDQLLDLQRTVRGDTDVTRASDAFYRTLGTNGQQCTAVGIDDRHAAVTSISRHAINFCIDGLQGTDAIASNHFQVRSDQRAAFTQNGLACFQADGGVATDIANDTYVTRSLGDDLLASGDSNVAQAQIAGGVQVQAGVDGPTVVDIEAVGGNAQRLVGRAVDLLVLVVRRHGLPANLQGRITGGVGLEHSEIRSRLGGRRGIANRRGRGQVGGSGVDRGVGDIQRVVQLDQQVLLWSEAITLIGIKRQGGGRHYQVDHGESSVGTGVTREWNGLRSTRNDRRGVAYHGGSIQSGVQTVGDTRHGVDLGALRVGIDFGQALGQFSQAVLQGGR